MPIPKVLIVEDSKIFIQLVSKVLGQLIHLDAAETGAEAMKKITSRHYDLILLDVMLPDTDGFQICSMIKSSDDKADIPIVFLSAKTSEDEKVHAFKLGAEDYITKPISAKEFKARIQARLRLFAPKRKMLPTVLRWPGLTLDLTSHRFTVERENKAQEVRLTKIEFKLLRFFMQRPDHLLTRELILQEVWPNDTFVTDRTVDVHISKLRRKLEPYGEWIESVFGEGYRFSQENHKVKAVS